MYVQELHVECESWKVFGKTFWTTSKKSIVKSQKSKVKSQKSKVKSQKSKVKSQKPKFNVLSKFEIVVVVLDGGAKRHTSYVLTK